MPIEIERINAEGSLLRILNSMTLWRVYANESDQCSSLFILVELKLNLLNLSTQTIYRIMEHVNLST